MRKSHFVVLLICCCLFGTAYGQTISGEIYDKANHEPIQGATVIGTKSKRAVASDADGKFTIELKGDPSFEVSYAGYKGKVVPVTSSAHYVVELETFTLDQVVVVGYGTQKKANLTGAVASVDIKKTFGSRPVPDVARGLQGAVAGLTITTATGDLGTDPKIRLRGLIGSLNAGSGGAKPLILVDNVEIPSLQMINPDDIESISVLKDAASASIYGTRGAWGVVLITTKSGKKGSPARVTYSNNFAWSTPINTPKLASAGDNAEASFTALRRTSPNVTSVSVVGMNIDSQAIAKIREWPTLYGNQHLDNEMVLGRDFEIRDKKLYFYRPWDAGEMYMKDWSLQQRHDLSVSGGSEKSTYTMGLGYLGQNGVLKVNPDHYNRYNLTLGTTTSVNEYLDLRGKIIYSNSESTTPFNFGSAQYGPWYYLYRWPAIYPYGTYKGKPFRSAVTEVQQAKMDKDKNSMARLSLGGTIKPIKDLTIDFDYTYTSVNEHLKQVGGGTMAYDFWSFNGDSLSYGNYQGSTYNKVRYYSYWNEINTGKAFATYVKKIGEHSLKAIAGGDIEYSKYTTQSAERKGMIDPERAELSLAGGDQLVDGSSSHWSTLGFFGRINYAYMNKYLLELNGRYDGSSRFPPHDKWAFFSSASLGYILTEEKFMDFTKPYLSFLKLRGSYGSIGNQSVGNGRFLALMSSSNSGWITPNGNMLTLGLPTVLSPSLTWEKVTTADAGIDTRFLDNKIGVSFDWYQRTTSNMIVSGVTLPSSFGTTPSPKNFGELRARGWELAVDFNHTFTNGLHLTFTGTLSDAKEKITKFANTTKSLPGPIAEINTTYYEGMTIGEIWGFETDRLFQEGDFTGQQNGNWMYKDGVPSQSKLESGSFYFGPGDIKYKDLNQDGIIYYGTNTVDNPGDKKIIGNSTPRYQYGFRIDADWKGFDIGIYFQGIGKRDFWASGPIVFPGFRAAEAWYSHQIDYWTPTRTEAFYPRPINYDASVDRWNFYPQTRYLLNLAYLRLKNMNIGYTLPKKIISKAHLERLRIYVTGENLLTFDHLHDIPIDPEIDFSQSQLDNDRAGFGRVYPYRRTFAFGLQLTL